MKPETIKHLTDAIQSEHDFKITIVEIKTVSTHKFRKGLIIDYKRGGPNYSDIYQVGFELGFKLSAEEIQEYQDDLIRAKKKQEAKPKEYKYKLQNTKCLACIFKCVVCIDCDHLVCCHVPEGYCQHKDCECKEFKDDNKIKKSKEVTLSDQLFSEKPIFRDTCGHYCLKNDYIRKCCICRTASLEDCDYCMSARDKSRVKLG